MDDPKKWIVLKSEYLFRRPWLTARRDHVRLPNGHENDEFYILEYPNWCNVIARTVQGEFVMIRQYRHGLGLTCYELPAGVVDPEDASPLHAAQRELLEETGFGGGTWQPFATLSANPSAMTNLNFTFVAEGVERIDAPHLEPTEDIDVCLMQPDEVRQLLADDAIKQSLMAAPLWKYFCLHPL